MFSFALKILQLNLQQYRIVILIQLLAHFNQTWIFLTEQFPPFFGQHLPIDFITFQLNLGLHWPNQIATIIAMPSQYCTWFTTFKDYNITLKVHIVL